MMWLIRRVLIVWFTLAAIFTAVLVIGRLHPGPAVLETLGFDVCEGKPCYKGVEPGMDWAQAQRQLSGSVIANPGAYASHVSNPIVAVDNIQIFSEGSTMVKAIAVEGVTQQGLPISVGAIVAQYGPPCRLDWYGNDYGPNRVFINYPSLLVFATIAIKPIYNPADLRLQPQTPVQELWITDDAANRACNTPVFGASGPWRGSISVDGYLKRLNASQ
jgi:hypothetical protein